MAHPLLRPRWIVGHVLAVVAIVVFVFAGLWQLRRHDEKVALRDEVQAAMEEEPVPLDEVPDGAFRRVATSGVFDPAAEFLVPRSRDGVSGYEVVGTLWPDGGAPLLVDRGWVGIDEEVPHPPREVVVEGILWPGQTGGTVQSATRFLSRVDPDAVSAISRYDLRDEYLILTDQVPDFDPGIRPPEIGEVSLGPHLGYAGQWFLFTAIVLVGYPVLLRRVARPRSSVAGRTED